MTQGFENGFRDNFEIVVELNLFYAGAVHRLLELFIIDFFDCVFLNRCKRCLLIVETDTLLPAVKEFSINYVEMLSGVKRFFKMTEDKT